MNIICCWNQVSAVCFSPTQGGAHRCDLCIILGTRYGYDRKRFSESCLRRKGVPSLDPDTERIIAPSLILGRLMHIYHQVDIYSIGQGFCCDTPVQTQILRLQLMSLGNGQWSLLDHNGKNLVKNIRSGPETPVNHNPNEEQQGTYMVESSAFVS